MPWKQSSQCALDVARLSAKLSLQLWRQRLFVFHVVTNKFIGTRELQLQHFLFFTNDTVLFAQHKYDCLLFMSARGSTKFKKNTSMSATNNNLLKLSTVYIKTVFLVNKIYHLLHGSKWPMLGVLGMSICSGVLVLNPSLQIADNLIDELTDSHTLINSVAV